MTYRADLVNAGPALASVSASVTSLDPFSVRVIPGQGTLNFSTVPANGKVQSNNTFTVLVANADPLDSSKLQWAFQTAAAPVANAGPNQTATVGSLVTLNGSSSTNASGAGTLTYSWIFSSVPPGSTTFLNHSSSVMPTFVVDVPGNYVITLTVSNGTASGSSRVTVSTSRTPPIANAGPNQTAALGSTVVLDGSGSTSVSGQPLTYAWAMLSHPAGSIAILRGANTVAPTYVVDKAGTYIAQLIVNDGLPSNPSTVAVTTEITPPVANAGSAEVVRVGAVVQLNGSGSTDANGLPLTYKWSLITMPQGSSATLSNPAVVNPMFTADEAGTYVAQLIVNNGMLNSTPVTVAISTQPPLAPAANAGSNQTVNVGSTVTLNGSGTDPQNLALTYQWSMISKPATSKATLSSTVISHPTFIADLAGAYVVQLIVSNGMLSSAPSTVTVSTTCAQPVANPGLNQNVKVGTTVTLDGSGSGDACRDPLTYAWSLTTRPAGSAATLSGPNMLSATFVADAAGTYVAQLVVNNGYSASKPATVTVTAATASATAIVLPSNLKVAPNQSIPFPVTLVTPAPSGGVFITLNSSDVSKVTVTPATFMIVEGAIAPSRLPAVTGVNAGSATITASAYGLGMASQLVLVQGTQGGATLSFSPGTLTLNGTAAGNLILTLPAPAPAGGLNVLINSSNPAAATVPASVIIVAGALSGNVAVTSIAQGSTTITASAPNFGTATATVSVLSLTQGVSVTWYGACWESATLYGFTGNFQAVDFAMTTPAPVTVQATLFFTSDCDPSQGTDNMNDFGTLTGSGHTLQGFTHHPNQIPSSAIYWVGPRTADGKCAPGSPCSGCLAYKTITPNCNKMP